MSVAGNDENVRLQGKWRGVPSGSLAQHVWGGESVIYNKLSGDTHLLGPLAVEILSQLQLAQLDAQSLAQSSVFLAHLDSCKERIEHIENILLDLDALALIEPALP